MLNFGLFLKNFIFVVPCKTTGLFYKSQLPKYSDEIMRVKSSKINKLRRYFGIPNIRIRFDRKNDVLFTYGSFLITNKPYCIYIENGLAVYNYDRHVANNLIAKYLVSRFIKNDSCKKLIFMSDAAKKSFLSSVSYTPETIQYIMQKGMVVYPLTKKISTETKKHHGTIKLLFVGQYYIKGGTELLKAFRKLKKQYPNVALTIVTPIHVIKESDIEILKETPGITLIDADLHEEDMNLLYQTHDIFVLPTYRDSFGMVLLEAISWGMPLIITDQFATTEMGIDSYNAFVFPNHLLKDYDSETYRLLGKYYNPKDFYKALFQLQKEAKLQPIEDFLFTSVEKYLNNPGLLEEHSKNSLKLYIDKFDAQKLSNQIETVFSEALKK